MALGGSKAACQCTPRTCQRQLLVQTSLYLRHGGRSSGYCSSILSSRTTHCSGSCTVQVRCSWSLVGSYIFTRKARDMQVPVALYMRLDPL